MTDARIRPRERDAIIQSLRAGVVPRVGHQHVQVGRHDEVKALVADIERISDGGSGIRFVIGEYGSGKTFFLHLVRSIALEKRLVTVHADLAPDRRLHATGGQARGLYAELMRNMATRARPDGGALASVVERFVTRALTESREGGDEPDRIIRDRLAELSEMTGGYDFAEVIACYWRGHD
ncbi:MAG TPA: BREX system ATP-binding domain-containing protein, partial [Mycobacteriales bacterium]